MLFKSPSSITATVCSIYLHVIQTNHHITNSSVSYCIIWGNTLMLCIVYHCQVQHSLIHILFSLQIGRFTQNNTNIIATLGVCVCVGGCTHGCLNDCFFQFVWFILTPNKLNTFFSILWAKSTEKSVQQEITTTITTITTIEWQVITFIIIIFVFQIGWSFIYFF